MIKRHDNHQALLQSSMFSKPWNEQITQSSVGRAADEEGALRAVSTDHAKEDQRGWLARYLTVLNLLFQSLIV